MPRWKGIDRKQRCLLLLLSCTLLWMADASGLASLGCPRVQCFSDSENLVLLDAVTRGAQVRRRLCPLLVGHCSIYWRCPSSTLDWCLRCNRGLSILSIKLTKEAKRFLHGSPARRTEITSWAANSATSSLALHPLPSTTIVSWEESKPQNPDFGPRCRVREYSGPSLTAQEYSKFFV